MIFMNFIRNAARHFSENRASLIRALLITAAAIAVVLLISAGVQRWHEKRFQALEKQFRDADDRAKQAEARAANLEYEIEARKAELADLQAKADAADAALKTARQKTITLKEAYETIRYVDVPAGTPVSVESACRELSGLGYECK